jgi:hypothetical protein
MVVLDFPSNFFKQHAKPYLFPNNTPSLTFFQTTRQALPFSKQHAKPYLFPNNTPSLTFFQTTRQALPFSRCTASGDFRFFTWSFWLKSKLPL